MHFTSNEGITQLPAKATVDLAGKLLINSQLEGFRQLSYEQTVDEKSYKHNWISPFRMHTLSLNSAHSIF